jgi:hypothetical protein
VTVYLNMPNTSHIHVRPLEISDFNFVRELASSQPNFTVPPVYVLWLMLKIKGGISLVAEHNRDGLLGYLIAVPIEGPADSMFVWQLAASKGSRRTKATLALLTQFREIIEDLSIRNIFFSTVPSSGVFRALRSYARKVFSSVPDALNPLPPAVNAKESEFLLNLSGIHRDGSTHASSSR